MDAPLGTTDTRAGLGLSGHAPGTAAIPLAGTLSGTMVIFTATLFVSSLLLFLIQPMVGKMILPMFGGTPAVWNTCMLFFQAVLLAGYGYAHLSIKWLGIRRQAIVHLGLLLVPLAVLPIGVAQGSPPPPDANPAMWLLWRLLISVGLPFFVVSSSAPLLQRWFAGTGHANSGDPYFLYAASNAGSLLALLAYPAVMEVVLPLGGQAHLWQTGYSALIVMTAVCVFMVQRVLTVDVARTPAASSAPSRAATQVRGESGPTIRERAVWVTLSFVPSSLMLGVTAHITTDLAAVPLLWVIPLGLYLLTFVLVFARRQLFTPRHAAWLFPFVVLPMALLTFLELRAAAWVQVPLHLLTFFLAAMVCHGGLARRRPSAIHLTGFFFWMSVGGVLGGIFNALIAPVIFRTVIEYPLAMVLACLLLPKGKGQADTPLARRLDLILPLGLAVLSAAIIAGLYAANVTQGLFGCLLAFGIPAVICFSFKDRPLRFGLAFAVILLAAFQYSRLNKGSDLHLERNFFGTKRVRYDLNGRFRTLLHGRTMHGMQSVDPARSRQPASYYHRTGPIGDVFAALGDSKTNARVAVIGLGVGGIAAYGQKGQRFTFYEIDPAVVRIAEDTRYFTFLSECEADLEVVLGDGRLRIASAPDHSYDLIILDAFSSDAIPAHLLTREAVRVYLDKLADGGLLVFHISNRYLDLDTVLGNLAGRMGLTCVARADVKVNDELRREGKLASHYAAMVRNADDLGDLAANPEWKPVAADPNTPIWTDQYSNILSVFRWR